MKVSHSLKVPILKTIETSQIYAGEDAYQGIWFPIGRLTTSWAALEFALTGMLINHSDMPPRSGYIMIGRMSSRSKFEKIISIMKADKGIKEIIELIGAWKKQCVAPCEIRNTIAHCAFFGTDIKDKNILYFGGNRLPEEVGTIRCYAITIMEINEVADFATNLAIIIQDVNLKQLQAKQA